MKVWIVMPAYNEERSIGKALDALKREGWRNIIVVDDGSHDQTTRIARSKGAFVVRHERNLGVGAAWRSGLKAARERGAGRVVTIDADGQHDPGDVRRLLEALDGADLVIGLRPSSGMPLNKRFGNWFLNGATYFLSGELTDSQSGFRALSRRALELELNGKRYEVCSEMIIRARERGLRLRGVPVKLHITPYSRGKGATIVSGIRIFLALLALKFRK